MIYIFVLFACLLFGFIEWKSIHLPLINFVLVMKWLRAMFLCMVVFAALTVVANDSFSQKEVRVCASTSLFSINHNSFDVFPRFWGEAFVSYCLIDFFPRFVYPVGSFVVLRTEGKLCSIKIRLLARTILLLCALSYAGLDMIMPCL